MSRRGERQPRDLLWLRGLDLNQRPLGYELVHPVISARELSHAGVQIAAERGRTRNPGATGVRTARGLRGEHWRRGMPDPPRPDPEAPPGPARGLVSVIFLTERPATARNGPGARWASRGAPISLPPRARPTTVEFFPTERNGG